MPAGIYTVWTRSNNTEKGTHATGFEVKTMATKVASNTKEPDNKGPIVTIHSPVDGVRIVKGDTFRFSVSATGNVLKMTLCNERGGCRDYPNNTKIDGPVKTSDLSVGRHVLKVSAFDGKYTGTGEVSYTVYQEGTSSDTPRPDDLFQMLKDLKDSSAYKVSTSYLDLGQNVLFETEIEKLSRDAFGDKTVMKKWYYKYKDKDISRLRDNLKILCGKKKALINDINKLAREKKHFLEIAESASKLRQLYKGQVPYIDKVLDLSIEKLDRIYLKMGAQEKQLQNIRKGAIAIDKAGKILDATGTWLAWGAIGVDAYDAFKEPTRYKWCDLGVNGSATLPGPGAYIGIYQVICNTIIPLDPALDELTKSSIEAAQAALSAAKMELNNIVLKGKNGEVLSPSDCEIFKSSVSSHAKAIDDIIEDLLEFTGSIPGSFAVTYLGKLNSFNQTLDTMYKIKDKLLEMNNPAFIQMAYNDGAQLNYCNKIANKEKECIRLDEIIDIYMKKMAVVMTILEKHEKQFM